MRAGFAVFAGVSVCLLVAVVFVYGSLVTSSIFERRRDSDGAFLVIGDGEEENDPGPYMSDLQPNSLVSSLWTLSGGGPQQSSTVGSKPAFEREGETGSLSAFVARNSSALAPSNGTGDGGPRPRRKRRRRRQNGLLGGLISQAHSLAHGLGLPHSSIFGDGGSALDDGAIPARPASLTTEAVGGAAPVGNASSSAPAGSPGGPFFHLRRLSLDPSIPRSAYHSLGQVLPFSGDLSAEGEVDRLVAARSFKGELLLAIFQGGFTDWTMNLVANFRDLGFEHYVLIGDTEAACSKVREGLAQHGEKEAAEALGCAWTSYVTSPGESFKRWGVSAGVRRGGTSAGRLWEVRPDDRGGCRPRCVGWQVSLVAWVNQTCPSEMPRASLRFVPPRAPSSHCAFA